MSLSNLLGGYLPEGNHRSTMASKRGIKEDDLFSLLREFGGSIAGAISLRDPAEPKTYQPSYEKLTEDQIHAKLSQALKEGDQGIPEDSRSTLPGYQPKVLVALIDNEWGYPHGRAHSTHILKPQIPARPTRIFDEHFSHLLGQRVGLSNFHSEIREANGLTYLAIERFDREITNSNVTLFHQEDMSQALGLDWENSDVKFQDPYNPNDPHNAQVRRIGKLLANLPERDNLIESWIRHLTYSIAIGDNDAHSKNIALMHHPGKTELSPVYDAVPNLFQEGLVSWNLALSINEVFDHRRMSIPLLLDEIALWDAVGEGHAEEIVSATLSSITDALNSMTTPDACSPGMLDQVKWNTQRLLAGNEIGERSR